MISMKKSRILEIYKLTPKEKGEILSVQTSKETKWFDFRGKKKAFTTS